MNTQQENRVNMAIEPKSDQMNYDDFLSGDKTITITGVKSTGDVNDAQPVSVGYQGDAGKPYKPCKSMRRVMVRVWGNDAIEYVGKSMTLFGDPNVIFAGQKVGGIRISHMSHIDKEVMVPLSASKTKRMLYKVLPLKVDMVDSDDTDIDEVLNAARTEADKGEVAFKAWFKNATANERDHAKTIMPELKEKCSKADKPQDDVDDPFGEHFEGNAFDVDGLLSNISDTTDNELLTLLQTNNQTRILSLPDDDRFKVTDAFTQQFDKNNKSA